MPGTGASGAGSSPLQRDRARPRPPANARRARQRRRTNRVRSLALCVAGALIADRYDDLPADTVLDQPMVLIHKPRRRHRAGFARPAPAADARASADTPLPFDEAQRPAFPATAAPIPSSSHSATAGVPRRPCERHPSRSAASPHCFRVRSSKAGPGRYRPSHAKEAIARRPGRRGAPRDRRTCVAARRARTASTCRYRRARRPRQRRAPPGPAHPRRHVGR